MACLASVDALEKPLPGIEPRLLSHPVPSLVTVCTAPSFLGAFAKKKTRQIPISFVMSVSSHWTDFREILNMIFSENLSGKIQVLLKFVKYNGHFT